jgi:hypothetical protein
MIYLLSNNRFDQSRGRVFVGKERFDDWEEAAR